LEEAVWLKCQWLRGSGTRAEPYGLILFAVSNVIQKREPEETTDASKIDRCG
jgi:hypothetical protein